MCEQREDQGSGYAILKHQEGKKRGPQVNVFVAMEHRDIIEECRAKGLWELKQRERGQRQAQ